MSSLLFISSCDGEESLLCLRRRCLHGPRPVPPPSLWHFAQLIPSSSEVELELEESVGVGADLRLLLASWRASELVAA